MTQSVACPNCETPMVRENFASALVDVCADGCHGIWFDAGELTKLDHAKKGLGPALERAVSQPTAASRRHRESLDCPHCLTPLDEVEYELAQWVMIDECAECDGTYLDAGELARIRSRPRTATEQTRADRHRRAKRRIRKRVLDEQRSRTRQAEINSMIHLFIQ